MSFLDEAVAATAIHREITFLWSEDLQRDFLTPTFLRPRERLIETAVLEKVIQAIVHHFTICAMESQNRFGYRLKFFELLFGIRLAKFSISNHVQSTLKHLDQFRQLPLFQSSLIHSIDSTGLSH